MRDIFYKYTDIDTAEAILKNRSFRYSSPLKFNDPFDIQQELNFNFDMNEFPIAAMKLIKRYVYSDASIPNLDSIYGKIILLLREAVKNNNYVENSIEMLIYPLLGSLIDETKHFLSRINSYWQKSMRESRVFCVTEKNDNLLMWAHYAKDHTGAVFEIKTMPEADTALSVAKKVQYHEKPLEFYSLDELIEWIIFDIKPDLRKLQFSNHAYRKSKDWSYENEWRVIDLCFYDHKNNLYIDHPFINKQLNAIYFGCRTDPKSIEHLSLLATQINQDVKLYKAKKRINAYYLDFEKI